MKCPHNEIYLMSVNIFHLVVSFIIFIILILVAFVLFIIHLSRQRFEQSAKKYIGNEYWQTHELLNLSKRELFFHASNYFIGATYIDLVAGDGSDKSYYRVHCYYNGKKYVCFLYEHSLDKENTIIDCYTTTPLKRNFDGKNFIGRSYKELYEQFGRPAVDRWFYFPESGGDSKPRRLLIYLLNGEFFLSNYVYEFYVNDMRIIDKAESVQHRFREQI